MASRPAALGIICMSGIGSLGKAFYTKLNDVADAAQDKAKTLQSKAGEHFGGLASRKSSSASAPRQSVLSQLKNTVKTDLKQGLQTFKQMAHEGAAEMKQGMADMKAFDLKQGLQTIKQTAHEGAAEIKQGMADMKAFGQYLRHGDDVPPTSSKPYSPPPPAATPRPTAERPASNAESHSLAPPVQPRRNRLSTQPSAAAENPQPASAGPSLAPTVQPRRHGRPTPRPMPPAEPPLYTRGGLPLPQAARAQLHDAPPLSSMAAKGHPGADKAVWAAMEQRDPIGAKCLSKIVSNALQAINDPGTDPRLATTYRENLHSTLSYMEAELSGRGGLPGLADKMVGVAVENLGRDDRAILAFQVFRAKAEALGFTAAQDVHLPQDAGVCHRAATKWAGCKVVGAPFKAEGMNIARIDDKQSEFGKGVRRRPAEPGENGFSKANVEYIEKWLGKFTSNDGFDKTVHRNEVSVRESGLEPPSQVLARQPLAEDEAMMVTVIARKPDDTTWCHTMALSGGSAPQLFDPGTQTIFDFRGRDPGQAVEKYFQMFVPGAKLDWQLTRVAANPLAG